jgi:hypothetical protein
MNVAKPMFFIQLLPSHSAGVDVENIYGLTPSNIPSLKGQL